MALKIRLSRGGAKKRPFYKIVVAEALSPRDGKFIERLGSYNPMVAKDHAERLVLDICLLYTSPSPRDAHESRMPSSA